MLGRGSAKRGAQAPPREPTPEEVAIALSKAEEAEETVDRNSRFLAFVYGIGAMLAVVVVVSRMWRDTTMGRESNDSEHDVYSMAGPLFALFAASGGVHASNLHSQSYMLTFIEACLLFVSTCSASGVFIFQLVHDFKADGLLVTLSWIWAAAVAVLSFAALVASVWNSVARRARDNALTRASRTTRSRAYLSAPLVLLSFVFPVLGAALVLIYWISVPIYPNGPFTYSLFSIGIPALSFGLSVKTALSFSKDARGVVYGMIIRGTVILAPIYATIRNTDIHHDSKGVWALDIIVLSLLVLEFAVWLGCVVTSDSYALKEHYRGCCAPWAMATDSLDAEPLLSPEERKGA